MGMNNLLEPKQAVEEYIGEQFIEWVMQYIPAEMAKWPIINQIGTAQPKPEKLKKLVLQSFLSEEAFLGAKDGDPGLLRFAISNLSESDDPTAESALELLEKRRQEELAGNKIEKGVIQTPKREAWIKLLKFLGLTDVEIDKSEPKEATRNYISELSDIFSNSEWQTAVGALTSHEKSRQEENRYVLELLKRNGINDKDLEVLSHEPNSDRHLLEAAHILEKVVFDEEGKNLVFEGVKRELDNRQEFLNGLAKYLEA